MPGMSAQSIMVGAPGEALVGGASIVIGMACAVAGATKPTGANATTRRQLTKYTNTRHTASMNTAARMGASSTSSAHGVTRAPEDLATRRAGHRT